jgi:hypothetical protein
MNEEESIMVDSTEMLKEFIGKWLWIRKALLYPIIIPLPIIFMMAYFEVINLYTILLLGFGISVTGVHFGISTVMDDLISRINEQIKELDIE